MWSNQAVLILVRHGRTAANAEGRIQGRLDLPLDEVGHGQAEALAAWVGPVDEVISSPLLRARQTAAAWGAEPRVDDRWVELDFGIYDGLPSADVPHSIWSHWRTDASFAPDGGESLVSLLDRLQPALDEMVESARHRDVVVVSHVSPIKAAMSWALGVGLDVGWRAHLGHAAICRIGFGANGPVLHSFNETAHLR